MGLSPELMFSSSSHTTMHHTQLYDNLIHTFVEFYSHNNKTRVVGPTFDYTKEKKHHVQSHKLENHAIQDFYLFGLKTQ